MLVECLSVMIFLIFSSLLSWGYGFKEEDHRGSAIFIPSFQRSMLSTRLITADDDLDQLAEVELISFLHCTVHSFSPFPDYTF